MSVSRRLVLLGGSVAALSARRAAAEGGARPAAIVQRFYDDLLAVMKEAKRLTFDQRYGRLAPAIGRTFNLGLMSRIAVGPEWQRLRPDQQQRVSDWFARYTISVYANRFDGYGGERFVVDPAAASTRNGAVVQTRLVKSDGETISLNYLMRQSGGAWQVIDVYLSGTVSELATRRSEFGAVLHRGGADALVRMLEQRVAELRTG